MKVLHSLGSKILFSMCLLFYSCIYNVKDDKPSPIRYFQIEIDDSLAISTVRKFVYKNHINSRKNVIYLTLKNNNSEHIVYVTYSGTALDPTSTKPAFYTFIDSSLVLIYEGSEKFIRNNKIGTEINSVLEEKGIDLYKVDNELVLEHNNIWQAFICDNKITININDDFSDCSPCK